MHVACTYALSNDKLKFHLEIWLLRKYFYQQPKKMKILKW